MGVKLIPPTRVHTAVKADLTPALRNINFLEDVARVLAELPDTIPDITDVSGLTISGNENKINEILAAMRT